MDIEEPFDIVKGCIAQRVKVELKSGREICGTMHAFDQHMNMVLAEVTEMTGSDLAPSKKRSFGMLFIRGDLVVTMTHES
jgi:U6 snRNA-associated Sm-like protein LSm3